MNAPPDFQFANNVVIIGGIVFTLGIWGLAGRMSGRSVYSSFCLANLGSVVTLLGFSHFYGDPNGQLFAIVGAIVTLLSCAAVAAANSADISHPRDSTNRINNVETTNTSEIGNG